MPTFIVNLCYFVSAVFLWSITILSSILFIKYGFVFTCDITDWYYSIIKPIMGFPYFLLSISWIIIALPICIWTMFGIPWSLFIPFTEKLNEKMKKFKTEYLKNYIIKKDKQDEMDYIERSRKEFINLSEAEQYEVVMEEYNVDAYKRECARRHVEEIILNQEKKRIEQERFAKKKAEEEEIVRLNKIAADREESIRKAKLTPEERYYEDKARLDEELRKEQRQHMQYEENDREIRREEEYNERKERMELENERHNSILKQNDVIAAELKKSNRSVTDKFMDLSLTEKIVYGYAGKKIYDKLGGK